ncbi:hypothetical protein CCHL11_02543 [Colletotrichum chlorophyti]|uniref:Rhodopsin domain-containing protein n=1 Tax=Colletotrichum chlorophyti TaxID=708187 RepID=A0A1Q8S927_9PEZI|nr:hypothetical protein CCHL11_02543 [Colletotrichum chlorophyti]
MVSDGINRNVTYIHPKIPPSSIPASESDEMDGANIPLYLTGILLPHAICTLFILARVVSRTWVLRKWFIDDTLIILSYLFSTALCIVYTITATTPSLLTAPLDQATLQNDANPYIMRTYLGLVYYQLCLCLTKLSLLAFYVRIFNSRPIERRLARITVAIVILFSFPMLLMTILQCHPSPGHFFGRPMKCFAFPDLLISSASLHSVTDAWLIAMVIPALARLDIPRRQKAALGIVLSLGVFVVAASMVRLQLSLHRHYRPSSTGVTNTLAFFVMTVLECDIALICACAPALRPLLARLIPGFFAGAATKRRSTPADGAESFDLTSLTYHGYPWTEPHTPFVRSRNGSIASRLDKLRPGMPPVPPLRTPTTLRHGAMITGSAPRSNRGWPPTGDRRPMLDQTWEIKRSSSIYSQDSVYDAFEHFDRHDGVILKTMTLSLRSEVSPPVPERGEPMSRWSPVSGLSGDTYAADRSSSGTKNDSLYGRMAAEIPKDEEGKPEVPPRSPLRDYRRYWQ